MTPLLSVRVHGLPAPQGSKIPGRSKAGKLFVREQNSVAQKSWRQDVLEAAVAARQLVGLETLDAAVWVVVEFFMPRPASVSIRRRPFPAVKPDIDKLVRNTLDGLKQAGVYADDALVVNLTAFKVYATDDPWHTVGAKIAVGLVATPEII